MISKFIFSTLLIVSILFAKAQNTIFKATQVYDYKQSDTKIIDQTYKRVINVFDEFEIYEIPLQEINNYIYANIDKPDFTLKLAQKYQWELSLELYNIFATDYRKSVQSANQKRTMELKSPKPFTFRAKVNNNQIGSSTLSIKQDLFIANIIEKDKQYYIEPLNLYNKNASANHFVVYTTNATKALSNTNKGCGQLHQPLAKAKQDAINNTNKTAMEVCAELAIAYDRSFRNYHGSASAAEAILTARLNTVASFFRTNFSIDFRIIEFYEAGANEITPDNNFTPCNQIGLTCSEGTILDDFAEWGEGENNPNSGFTSTPDVATFFTGKGVSDFYGYSYVNGICNSLGYHWVEENVPYNNESRRVNLWIHEMGHTWNAYHTSNNNTNSMMYHFIATTVPMIVESSTFNAIINHKNSRTCLDAGYCIDITAPVASFSSQIDNCSKLVVFNDNSTNTPQSWLWNFGDGTTSTLQNPAHTYWVDGTYTVSLRATNSGGSSTFSQTITISEEGCDDCAPLLSMNQQIMTSTNMRAETIECSSEIGSSENVSFIAGNTVTLNNNFRVPATANFSALIEPCEDRCEEDFSTFTGPYTTASTDPFGTYPLSNITLTIDANNSNRLIHNNFYGWTTADGNQPIYFDLDCTNNTITVPTQNYTTPRGYFLTINGGSGTYNSTTKYMEIIFNVTHATDGNFTITETFTISCNEDFSTFTGPYTTASTDPFGTYPLSNVTLTVAANNSNRLIHNNFYGWTTADGNQPIYFDLDCTNNTITVPTQNYTTPRGYFLTINGGSGTYNFTTKYMEIVFNVTHANDGNFTITETFTISCNEDFSTFTGPYTTASTDPFGTYPLSDVTLMVDANNSNRLIHNNFYGWTTADGNQPIYFDLDCTNNTITVPTQNYTTPRGYFLTINGGSGTYNSTTKYMEIIFNVTHANDGNFTITETFTR